MVENPIQGIQKHWDALVSIKLVEKHKFSVKDGEEAAIKTFNDTMEAINNDVQELVPASDKKKTKIWNDAIDFYTALNSAPTEVPADEEPAEETPGDEPGQEQEQPGEEDPGEEGEPADESAPKEEQEQTMETKKDKATAAKGKATAAKGKATAAKKSTESAGKRGRAPAFGPEAKIKVLKKGSPFREGSGREPVFQCIVTSKTVGEAREKATKQKLRMDTWDFRNAVEKGFVSIG